MDDIRTRLFRALSAPETPVQVGPAVPDMPDGVASPNTGIAILGPLLTGWPDTVAAFPTDLTRSALFGLPRRGRRAVIRWQRLAARGDVELYYHGEQLDQGDCDAWLAALRFARNKPLGERIVTTRYAFLRELGRGGDARSYRWLDSVLDRLSSAALRVQIRRSDGHVTKVRCGLLTATTDTRTGLLAFRLDPDGAALFKYRAYIDWRGRLALTSLAKALQLYASGHRSGAPHSVALHDLQQWLGYGGRPRQFRAALKEALSALERAGFIEAGSLVDHDRAVWRRSATPNRTKSEKLVIRARHS